MELIKSATKPEQLNGNAYVFMFSNNDIVVKKEPEKKVSIPCIGKKTIAEMTLDNLCFLGTVNDMPCYCAQFTSAPLPEEYRRINLRALYGKIDDFFWGLSGYARQMSDWNMNFKFCGRCGARTDPSPDEHARVCPGCGLTSYPRISPAVITAVVKENKLLLARGINFPDKKMFSVLAGFVEPGETLEQCVQREIFEEVGIRVNHIQYFKSQPWPFPDSLMIGFTACWESGELSIDEQEIVEAGWFGKKTLPRVPGQFTLAGELIDWFVQNRG